uniref:Uncharacterized protein n=1 Tax=Moniliophthora roreri TaxID=221103 RepID=A0A0W0FA48_MONRR
MASHYSEMLSALIVALDHRVTVSYLDDLTTAGILLSYIIQSVRIWCAWRKNNFVKVIIIALTIGLFIPDGIALNGIIRSLEFLDPPPKFRGCIIIGGKNTYTPWILWLAYDTSASILMLIPGISAYREGGLSRLMRVMYQDGVIYFILMAILSTINIVVMAMLSPDYAFILGPLERVLHCILTSHMIIHIRQIAFKNHNIDSVPM